MAHRHTENHQRHIEIYYVTKRSRPSKRLITHQTEKQAISKAKNITHHIQLIT